MVKKSFIENGFEDLKNKLKSIFNAENKETGFEDLKNKLKSIFNAENKETSEIVSDNLPVILRTDDRPIRNIGYSILFVMIGVFGTWSYIAPIGSSSLASGVVAVKTHRKTIQHLEGGIVDSISVRDGDYVNSGATLLTLDSTQVKAQIEIFSGQYISLAAIDARLTAERTESNEIKFPDTFKDLNDSRVQEAIQGQQQIFIARGDSHKGEINLLSQRVKQLGLKITGLKTQQKSKRRLLGSYAEEISDIKELLAEGFADKQRLRELQRQHTMTQGDIASLTTEVASAQMQQGETELEIVQTTRKFQEQIATQSEEVNAELFSINEQLIVAVDKAERSIIKAPVSGFILGMATHTDGGVVMPGSPILDIVPEDEELIVTAQVALMDIDKVVVGTSAEIRFSAFSSKTTPVMEGRVKTISADTLTDPVTGMPFYEAVIELTPESTQKLGGLVLIPGMPTEVLINTGKRTFFEYLVQPLSDAFSRSFIEE
ncbi:MAG: HlyD family type I secretion periplasmic adaptor subunit [Gammaproteobacteria bacterium]|nr:HlyD family type I secretion periplasmic adaptor subunit [Gammaproteobacteria bacterium]